MVRFHPPQNNLLFSILIIMSQTAFTFIWLGLLVIIGAMVIKIMVKLSAKTETHHKVRKLHRFKCKHCGKWFTATRVAGFCSTKCNYAYKVWFAPKAKPTTAPTLVEKEVKRGRGRPRLYKASPTPNVAISICKVCGSNIKGAKRTACSHKCRKILSSATMRQFYQKHSGQVVQPLQNIIREIKEGSKRRYW